MNASNGSRSSEDQSPQIGPDEIAEILNAFEQSDWSGMHLTVGGVTVSVGKDAPPPEPRNASAAVPVASAVTEAPASAPAAPAADPAPAKPVTREAPVTAAATAAEPIDETGLITVTAPTVGAFWVAPDPGSPPFVEVGSRVAAGDQIAIIEVMKLMNPVVCEVSGVVAAVSARNADLVEFGQPLFLIRPDD